MFENLLFVKYNYHATLRFRNTDMLRWESIISASKTVKVRFLFLLFTCRFIKNTYIYIHKYFWCLIRVNFGLEISSSKFPFSLKC